MAIGRTRAEAMPPHPLTFTTALMASLSLVFNSFSASAFAPTRTFTLGSSSSSLISGTTPSNVILSRASHNSRPIFARTFLEEETKASSTFDPLGYSDSWDSLEFKPTSNHPTRPNYAMAPTTAALTTLLLVPQPSHAAKAIPLSTGDFNPDSFKPVCAASDSFYRFLQGSTRAVVGDENFSEYGPLIAGGLLRIRLELCVVESFFNEAVGPFIKENGLTWILPWHETVETFIAGSIFALATTFILVGSTKIIQILAFYSDLILGGPCRLFGGFFFDRARGEPVTLDVSFLWWKKRLIGPPVDFKEEELKKKLGEGEEKWLDLDNVKAKDVPLLIISGGIKLTGEVLRVVREVVEAVDLFVGRYLVLLASGYIIIKFVHFKIFPDFP